MQESPLEISQENPGYKTVHPQKKKETLLLGVSIEPDCLTIKPLPCLIR